MEFVCKLPGMKCIHLFSPIPNTIDIQMLGQLCVATKKTNGFVSFAFKFSHIFVNSLTK